MVAHCAQQCTEITACPVSDPEIAKRGMGLACEPARQGCKTHSAGLIAAEVHAETPSMRIT